MRLIYFVDNAHRVLLAKNYCRDNDGLYHFCLLEKRKFSDIVFNFGHQTKNLIAAQHTSIILYKSEK